MKVSREHRVSTSKRALEVLLVKNRANAAHARSDLFGKRRALMESSSAYLAA